MHIAVIAGGPSEEREVSLNSAQLIVDHLDKNKHSFRLIEMETKSFIHRESGQRIDLNDFSLNIDGNKEFFDFAFIIIHGRPAENGKLQGYFDWMNIPYSTAGVLCSALTFNKHVCKQFLSGRGIPMARSVLIGRSMDIPRAEVAELGLPLFVKPNNNGSSVAVTKISDLSDLDNALAKVFEVDDEALVEEFIDGVEYSAGVIYVDQQTHTLPVTEIRPTKEFFDYEAKYLGASEEITPARLSVSDTQKIQELSSTIYHLMGCTGVCRVDFIHSKGEFYFLEVNTIPGMSKASMIPQQSIAYGWSITTLLEKIMASKLM
ncbi:D-alanine--D-alanine ligase family protein [Membranihabitans marinus]|uniref:D-alanine--D-alanine ligase family protein n=1 Tax=Membranihabitans marinus TaxID=1227546 RepID=UPI001F02E81F|nr:D-alanine--D-alanine ligase [Membranihabitans marinus]